MKWGGEGGGVDASGAGEFVHAVLRAEQVTRSHEVEEHGEQKHTITFRRKTDKE